ncbi:MAG: respiratory chain complex I subunit 1 family protein [Chloroflexota bacterium]
MASLGLLVGQSLLVLVLSPFLTGFIKAVKAFFQGRQGPPITQSAFDVVKYLARESVVSEHASWIARWAPAVYFATNLVAAGLLPTLFGRPPLERVGDAVALVGLMALGRFALAVAALDTGSNFGGMGTSREMAFAALVEPALLLALFALAIPAGSTALPALVAGHWGPSRLLALGALFIVAIAETGRIPIDNPDTHLELTMAHEGMTLEYSGRSLGLVMWGSHVKQVVVVSLLAALFLPWGMADQLEARPLTLGLASYVAKLGVIGLALALVETSYAKLRIFRVPDLLGAASFLAFLALISVYVVGR